jgi:hypothetical protein
VGFVMGYVLDTKRIPLMSYKHILKNQRLLPARQMLKDRIDENFKVLASNGIKNVDDLRKVLAAPAKVNAFSIKTGIPTDYLKILKRELGSLLQKPVKLSDFPDMDSQVINRLTEINIMTTKDYFELCEEQDNLDAVARKIHATRDDAYEWLCMCSLCRINGIGAVAAKMFYKAGYHTVEDVGSADAQNMLTAVSKINEEKQYYKAKLGLKDMQFCIDFAQILIQFADN